MPPVNSFHVTVPARSIGLAPFTLVALPPTRSVPDDHPDPFRALSASHSPLPHHGHAFTVHPDPSSPARSIGLAPFTLDALPPPRSVPDDHPDPFRALSTSLHHYHVTVTLSPRISRTRHRRPVPSVLRRSHSSLCHQRDPFRTTIQTRPALSRRSFHLYHVTITLAPWFSRTRSIGLAPFTLVALPPTRSVPDDHPDPFRALSASRSSPRHPAFTLPPLRPSLPFPPGGLAGRLRRPSSPAPSGPRPSAGRLAPSGSEPRPGRPPLARVPRRARSPCLTAVPPRGLALMRCLMASYHRARCSVERAQVCSARRARLAMTRL